MAEEVTLVQAWLREHLGMVVPRDAAPDGTPVVLQMLFDGWHLWRRISLARRALGMRRLCEVPAEAWVSAVFNVMAVWDV